MALLDPLFGSAAMGEVFTDAARLQRMLDFEAALARAEAGCGVIPPAAAPAIASKCKAELIDANAVAAALSSPFEASHEASCISFFFAVAVVAEMYASRICLAT